MESSISAASEAQHLPPAPHTLYQLRLAGNLDHTWQEWFDDMRLSYDAERDETVLTGAVTDQAALHGLLAKIRDLGLPLVELHRVTQTSEFSANPEV
jgi:hypothetical protein